VDCDIQCMLCEENVEDDIQAFFTYVSAQSSWQVARLSSIVVSTACQQGSVADRLCTLCQNEDRATIGRVTTFFWSIWHNRSDKIWNDNVRLPSQVGRAGYDHWNVWFVVHNLRRDDDHYISPSNTDQWEKPRIEWLK
jgi:hypothetical protein